MSAPLKTLEFLEPKAKRHKKDKSLHDDLIAQFLGSSYRPKIGVGVLRFIDKQFDYRKSYFKVIGHHIFKYFYMKSESTILECNPGD